MVKQKSTHSAPRAVTPKRGAIPTPRSVLSSATPFEADQSDLAVDQPPTELQLSTGSSRAGIQAGGILMSDDSGSSFVGTAGTPPPPSGGVAGGQRAGAGNVGTAGKPPPPAGGAAGGSRAGAGNVGTAGTPPPPKGNV